MSPLRSAGLPGAVPIDVPYADVRGDELRWALGLPARAPLAGRTVRLDDGREIALHVLGASHQVLVRRGRDVLLSETVACDLTGAESLPASAGTLGYCFSSAIAQLPPTTFAERVDHLVRELADDPAAIVAGFPGAPYAVTAIALSTEGPTLTWQTWHAYPQSGELVHTTTHLDATEVAHG